MAVEVFESFEDGYPLWTAEGEVSRISDSATQALAGVKSLDLLHGAPNENDAFFIARTDPPSLGDDNRTYWARYGVYIDLPDWNTLFVESGGGETAGFLRDTVLANWNTLGMVFFPDSATTAIFRIGGTSGGDLSLDNTYLQRWLDVQVGLKYEVGTDTFTYRLIVDALDSGTQTLIGAGVDRTPRALAVGNSGGDPAFNFDVYVDAYGYQPDTQIPDDYIEQAEGVPCAHFGRFYEAPLWRFVVTDLDGVTTTWLDKLTTDNEITLNHLAPSTISGQVPSDNPEVNIDHTDGYPFLDEGDRLIYCFRRDCLDDPYVIRAAGTVLNIEDSGDQDAPVSTWSAWDPWQILYTRPVRNSDGTVLSGLGLNYPAGTTYDEILIEQLNLMVTYSEVGGGWAPWAFTDWGAMPVPTGFYTGTVETTAALTEAYNIQQGTSVGALFDDLVATGEVEPVFEPIYDPLNRPGFTHQLSIYIRAGAYQPAAIMAWDEWPRTLAGINHIRDGRERMNDIIYHAGQGGPGISPPPTDGPSIARFGDYLRQQFFPANQSIASVREMANRILALQASGLITYSLAPAAARAPVPFIEYDRGDTVPVYASRRLRSPINGDLLRVQSIPIKIGADQLERIPALIVSLDELSATTGGGAGGGGGAEPTVPPDDLHGALPETDVDVTLYVSTGGDDPTGDGSIGNPYRTVGKAFSVIPAGAAGYKIIVRGGTYTGLVLQNKLFDITNPLTIENYTAENVVFAGTSSLDALSVRNVQGMRVRGRIGGGLVHFQDGASGKYGIRINNSMNIEMIGLDVHDNDGQGILVGGFSGSAPLLVGSQDVDIYNCDIYENGGSHTGTQIHGVYYGANQGCVRGVLANNVVRDQHTGYGMQIGQTLNGTIVANNTIVRADDPTTYAGNGIQLDFTQAGPFVNVVVVNNIIAHSKDGGVAGSESGKAIYGPGTSLHASVSAHDNLGYSNAAGDGSDFDNTHGAATTYTLGANNDNGDPDFVNDVAGAGGDFHLGAASVALAVADPAYAPAFDHDGNARGPTPDLGAFERA